VTNFSNTLESKLKFSTKVTLSSKQWSS